MKPLLSVREVSFSYKTKEVIQGVTFDAGEGDTIAIVGANGAGKTTLLKILCGLLSPTTGEVLLRERALAGYKPRELARCIAMVPQDIQVTFDFTVREFVEQGRTPHISSFLGSLQPADRAAIADGMELADISHMAGQKFSQLSGGEKQRVKIALALAQQPQILLLDEPAQNLDIGRQAEVFSILHRLNETGITIIAAIHDLHSVYSHFSKSLVLRSDTSCCYGPPETILSPEALQGVFGRHIPLPWLNGIVPGYVPNGSSPRSGAKEKAHEQEHSD